jgi:hypothetical protein
MFSVKTARRQAGRQDRDDVIPASESHFVINAFSETERESFRLDLEIHSGSLKEENIKLDINWPTEPFSHLRDCFYLRGGGDDDWTPVWGVTAPRFSASSANASAQSCDYWGGAEELPASKEPSCKKKSI